MMDARAPNDGVITITLPVWISSIHDDIDWLRGKLKEVDWDERRAEKIR